MLPHLDRLALVLVLEAEGLVLDQLRKNISTKKKWWRRRRKAISKEREDTITINTSVLLVILVTLDAVRHRTPISNPTLYSCTPYLVYW